MSRQRLFRAMPVRRAAAAFIGRPDVRWSSRCGSLFGGTVESTRPPAVGLAMASVAGGGRQGHRLWAGVAQWARQGHPPFGAKPGRGGAPNPGAYEGKIALLHRRVAGLCPLATRAASRWSFARFNHRNQDLKPLLLKLTKSISIQEPNQILVRKA